MSSLLHKDQQCFIKELYQKLYQKLYEELYQKLYEELYDNYMIIV